MRITYIHQYFNTPAMSGSTRSYEMAKRLVEMGHEVNVITSKRDGTKGSTWEVTSEAGINVFWINVPYSNYMNMQSRVSAFIKFAFHASLKASSIKSDLIYASSTPLTIALPAAYAKWKLSVPMILEVRDLWPDVPIAMGILENRLIVQIALKLEAFAYRIADAIVALSPDMRDGIVEKGYPQNKIHVIPNASDLQLFRNIERDSPGIREALQISRNKFIMIYAGTLGRVNRVDYLVKLADLMKNDLRIHFIVIGDGSEKGVIQSMAIATGCLDNNLSILSPVSKSKIAKVLSETDICISLVAPIPALEANSANKIFDGMAAGNCVAINHGGWLKNVIVESAAGMVLSRDPNVAACELADWLNNPQKIFFSKVNARRLAEEEYSRDKLVKTLNDIIIGVKSEFVQKRFNDAGG